MRIVLGRVLLAARIDVNSFGVFLSGNAEVAFASMTATTTPATSLATPATSATTSTENVVAITASMMSALTTTVTGSLPTAAAAVPPSPSSFEASTPTVAAAVNVATPSAEHKRKARPQSYQRLMYSTVVQWVLGDTESLLQFLKKAVEYSSVWLAAGRTLSKLKTAAAYEPVLWCGYGTLRLCQKH
jgi:hypothetical protein